MNIELLTSVDRGQILAALQALQDSQDGLAARVTALESSGGSGGGGTGSPVGMQIKVVTATRDLSAAAGTQDVTGFGFDPTACIVFGAQTGSGMLTIGAAATTGDHGLAAQTSGGACHAAGGVLYFAGGIGSNQQHGVLSFIPGGVRIDWSKVGSPSGAVTFHVFGIGAAA